MTGEHKSHNGSASGHTMNSTLGVIKNCASGLTMNCACAPGLIMNGTLGLIMTALSHHL